MKNLIRFYQCKSLQLVPSQAKQKEKLKEKTSFDLNMQNKLTEFLKRDQF